MPAIPAQDLSELERKMELRAKEIDFAVKAANQFNTDAERKLEIRAKEIAHSWKVVAIVATVVSVLSLFGVPKMIRDQIAEKMTEGPIRAAAINATTNTMGTYVAQRLAPLSEDIVNARTTIFKLNGSIESAQTELRTIQAGAKKSLDEISVKLDALNQDTKAAINELTKLKQAQKLVSLVARVEAFDSDAMVELSSFANGNDDNAVLARSFIRAVNRNLEHEKRGLIKGMPVYTAGTNRFTGPFTSDEIASHLALSPEGAINWVGEQKYALLLPSVIEVAQKSRDLWLRNRAVLAVENITGNAFEATDWPKFEIWWEANKNRYAKWPMEEFENAMNSLRKGKYEVALQRFLAVLAVDPNADKSRALAVACAVELLEFSKAKELNASYREPSGRWPRWAEAKVLLHTGHQKEGTQKLAALFNDGSIRFGDTFTDQSSHLMRLLDWQLFSQLTANSTNSVQK
jgi:hypothetical protein